MKRLKSTIAYDGTNFEGYQIQPNGRTVQGELQSALNQLHKGSKVKVYASGRTDAGVHAAGQVIHFDTNLHIPPEKWPYAMHTKLPADIRILSVEEVPSSFHARFSVVQKEYRYKVWIGERQDVFQRHYTYFYPFKLNIASMEVAKQYLIGTHDFTSFCSSKTEIEDKVRTIYELDIYEEENVLVFRVVGNGFLYNMVRIIVGTLLDVGRGKINANNLTTILKEGNREQAGKTAPAHGLYLWNVVYNDN
ncbi:MULTISPECIES: tRNA pseudouridine(38-40) synthase TruA [Sutcliffiella]|uniref:tRNA pseudouridine synthase A n=1 Tax=Sutcliffiella cohnii TaxID=33932 RepID=A0A223KX88_9BACI|nr:MULTISPECIES: tRNA pseudouridine(38-40) synthase TruA [Sutcliffiella]AST94076.1 tRNA pseudouridine(38-40) synthase TruA [Sutcliffiella cohnii]MED4018113.1 tRNA pseudouridine(38-40) synthase TruA [Sutcliffiella cohnii]WBL15292.1 tRNA pseudouridine(38-40) synthase TruA [Sutcliffiella sp. NC1]